METRVCNKCGIEKQLTLEFFLQYKLRSGEKTFRGYFFFLSNTLSPSIAV